MTCYYLVNNEGRTPSPNTKWVRVRLAPTRRFRINLQGTFMNRKGRDTNRVIFLAPCITWYFKSDTETPKVIRYLVPKPVEIPDPIHPFSVKTDYPAIYQVFISKGITKFGNYTTDDKSWTKKPPFTLTQTERQDRRQWIYRELMRNWLLQEST
jgi:hypothetical protein